MYPNSNISAGEMAIIAVVTAMCLAAWIVSVFIAARPPRRNQHAAATPLSHASAATEAAEAAARDAGLQILVQRAVAPDEELGHNLVTKIRHAAGVVALRDELTYPPAERSIAGLYF
jgi:hypothetical protein